MMTARPDQDTEQQRGGAEDLPPGTTLLHGQYTIESFLSSGGFAITYLARDSLDRRVVIKECFPTAFCKRRGDRVVPRTRAPGNFSSMVGLFVEEARNLARLQHPNIVGVHQVFEDNDTAYMALDYVRGVELLELIEGEAARLTPAETGKLLATLLDTVEYIHGEGVLHRDISPDNILIRENGSPVLIDFGAARANVMLADRRTALLAVKDGYSPQEFYITGTPQHPSSDLYALAATFYHLISGELPPNSHERLSAVAQKASDPCVPVKDRASDDYDPRLLGAIDRGMQIFAKDRFQSAADWKAYMADETPPSGVEDGMSFALNALRDARQKKEVGDKDAVEAAAEKPRLKVVGSEGDEAQPTPVRPTRPVTQRPDVPPQDETTTSETLKSKPGRSRPTSASPVETAVAAMMAANPEEETAAEVVPVRKAASKPVPDQKPAPDAAMRSDVPAAPKSSNTMVLVAGGVSALAMAAAVIGYFTLSGGDQGVSAVDVAAADPVAVQDAQVPADGRTSVTETVPAVSASAEPGVAPSGDAPAVADAAPEVAADPAPESDGASVLEPTLDAAALGSGADRTAAKAAVSHSLSDTPVRSPSSSPAPAVSAVLAALPEAGTDVSAQADTTAPAPILPSIDDPDAVAVSPVMSGWVVDLPFETDDTGLTITSVRGNAPSWMTPGQTIASVGAIAVSSTDDIRNAIRLLGAPQADGTWQVPFNVIDSGATAGEIRTGQIPAAWQVTLLNGVSFETRKTGGTWATTVIDSPFDAAETLQPGDRVVGYVPTGERIEAATSLSDILKRERANGVTTFDFAISRTGELWAISMPYAVSELQ